MSSSQRPIGTVAQLWRYPVKSMRGDRITRAGVHEGFGVPGDRAWAIRDEEVGELRGAKQLRNLMQFHARYLSEPATAEDAPPIEITLPDGDTVTSDAPDVDERLSAAVGSRVSLHPRQPATAVEHYRRASAHTMESLRTMLDLDDGEPMPDFSASITEFTQETVEVLKKGFTTPPGTYFDMMPLSLLTTRSLRTLAGWLPESDVDVRRFRKNLIVATDEPGAWPELDWIGRRIRIGGLVALVSAPISRCVMVTLPQDDLPRDRAVLKTLARQAGSNFGVYLRVVEPGEITEGDTVVWA